MGVLPKAPWELETLLRVECRVPGGDREACEDAGELPACRYEHRLGTMHSLAPVFPPWIPKHLSRLAFPPFIGRINGLCKAQKQSIGF